MNIHIFNPEHDIALAANSKFWTAPHAGRQLRADLGWLPAIWADNGDAILVDDPESAERSYRKARLQQKELKFIGIKDIHKLQDLSRIDPWGWDRSIVHQLEIHGVSRSLMPSDKILDKIRLLSNRATSMELLSVLRQNLDDTCGKAWSVSSVQEINEKRKELGSIVLKSPWSSSGRGIRYINGTERSIDNIYKWAEKVIRTQGHIMVEQYLNKVKDFGMEFTIHPDGKVSYNGLSLFHTQNGSYEGSILATEEEKQGIITQYLNKQLLSDVQSVICKWFEQNVSESYAGPFGIDMMIDAEGKLNPCVEINLRRTMGHVALALSPKDNGRQEIMRISYEGTNYHFRRYNNHEILI